MHPARARRLRAIVLTLVFAGATETFAQPPEPIAYTLSFPAPQTHYVEVRALVPTARRPQVELMMPVWTPGSYLVREYARHVENVRAATPDGKPLAVDKSRKNRWWIDTGGAPGVVVTYRVSSREMGVRGNWVEDGFAMLNGAPTFMTLVERGPRAHDVTLELPERWKTSITGLPEAPGGTPHRYRAPDYDTLVDSPIVAGNPAVYRFEVDGKPHDLVNEGEGGIWDGPRSAQDVEKIVREARRLWAFLPYDTYVFFNMITEAGGGLEHKNSTLLKGAVIAFVLDAKIRRATAGARSLDEVMRLAYSRYSGARGFTPDQFRAVAQEVAGIDLRE